MSTPDNLKTQAIDVPEAIPVENAGRPVMESVLIWIGKAFCASAFDEQLLMNR